MYMIYGLYIYIYGKNSIEFRLSLSLSLFFFFFFIFFPTPTLDCNARFATSDIRAALDTRSLSVNTKASYDSVFASQGGGEGEGGRGGEKADDAVSYFEVLSSRADKNLANTTGMDPGEARLLREAFVALDGERSEFLDGSVTCADLFRTLMETGKSAPPTAKLAWSSYLKAGSSAHDEVTFKELTVERGLQAQEAEFYISKAELKRIRFQFTMLDDGDCGKVVFAELIRQLKQECDFLGESLGGGGGGGSGDLWSQLPNHVTGVDKDGKVSLVDFLAGRGQIALMNKGNLTSNEILDIKDQYRNDDTQLAWKDYLLSRAPLVVERRLRNTIPTGEDAEAYLMKSRTGMRGGKVVTLPDLLIEGCSELCRSL